MEELTRLVSVLSRKSIRLLDARGGRATIHILQARTSQPDGYRLTFAPGIIDAVTKGEAWEPLEILRFLEPRAF